MAGVLYQPAFAALTRWYGPQRVRALTAVTLVAGLASTGKAAAICERPALCTQTNSTSGVSVTGSF